MAETGVTEGNERYVAAFDDLRLGFRDLHPSAATPHSRPIVCLPGLTRNGRDFQPLARFLSHSLGRRVISIDYRGRGLSERAADPASYTVPVEARDVLTVLDHLDISRADFIGTSRGGLILHILAATAPERLGAVIFNDIGPELGIAGLREIQSYLTPGPAIRTWDTAALRLKDLHGRNFPLLSDTDWHEMARATLIETADGIVADCDPAIGEAFRATDLSQPLPTLWNQFDLFPDVAMMVVRGEYSKLLTPETVAEMRRRRPDLIEHLAEGQGHAPLLHLDGLDQAIADFLARG